MKVVLPVSGLGHTSKDILPASCTSKPNIACTSVPKVKVNEGLTNQEIYQSLIGLKDRIASFFGIVSKPKPPMNYLI